MHDIEPHFKWRNVYESTRDERSPFFGKTHSEFHFTNKVYNYYIHPQWDEIGSPTLYLKVLYVDYDDGAAIIELIGEWNDAINNDIMFLKREIIDVMMTQGIHRFLLVGENVLNFHGDEDCYYEEWYDDVSEEGGWVCILNLLDHVVEEMKEHQIHYYLQIGYPFINVNWRVHKPKILIKMVQAILDGEVPKLAEAE